jgi:hypothetical protein
MSQRLFEGVGEKDSGPEQGTAEYRVGSGAGQASRGVLFLGTSLQRSAPTRICKQPPPLQGKSPKPAISKQKNVAGEWRRRYVHEEINDEDTEAEKIFASGF